MMRTRILLGIALFTTTMLCGFANFAESKAEIIEGQIKSREEFRKHNEEVREKVMHEEEAAKRLERARDKGKGTKSREEAEERMRQIGDKAHLRLEEIRRKHDERRKSVFDQ
ncbi:MAG: hypothetical protein JW808_00675 [Victivallales bacterium]|nr:hypothetical protein [Victivallales bacterium]